MDYNIPTLVLTIILGVLAAWLTIFAPKTERAQKIWIASILIVAALTVLSYLGQRSAEKQAEVTARTRADKAEKDLYDLQMGQTHIGTTTEESHTQLGQVQKDLDSARAKNVRLQHAIENVAGLSASCPDALKVVLLLSRSNLQIITDAKLLNLRLESLAAHAGRGWLVRLEDRNLRVGSASGHPGEQEAVRQKFTREMDALWNEIMSDLRPLLIEARVREEEMLTRLPTVHEDTGETPEAKALLLPGGQLEGTTQERLKELQDLATYMAQLSKVFADENAKDGDAHSGIQP